MFDPDAEFTIERILLPPSERTRFIRYLVSTRHLTALMRAFDVVQSSEPVDHEALLILLLHLVGSTKEAADRFRDCDDHRMFGIAERSDSQTWRQLKKELATVRRDTDRSEPTSAYCTMLKPFRDTAGFHIREREIEEAIAFIREMPFKAARMRGADVIELPMVRAILALTTWAKHGDGDRVGEMIEQLRELQKSLRDIAHDFYFLHVALSNLRDEESGTG